MDVEKKNLGWSRLLWAVSEAVAILMDLHFLGQLASEKTVVRVTDIRSPRSLWLAIRESERLQRCK